MGSGRGSAAMVLMVVLAAVAVCARVLYEAGRLHIIKQKSLANDFMFESTLNCDGRIHKYVTTFSFSFATLSETYKHTNEHGFFAYTFSSSAYYHFILTVLFAFTFNIYQIMLNNCSPF